jgi:hypothetical protein
MLASAKHEINKYVEVMSRQVTPSQGDEAKFHTSIKQRNELINIDVFVIIDECLCVYPKTQTSHNIIFNANYDESVD